MGQQRPIKSSHAGCKFKINAGFASHGCPRPPVRLVANQVVEGGRHASADAVSVREVGVDVLKALVSGRGWGRVVHRTRRQALHKWWQLVGAKEPGSLIPPALASRPDSEQRDAPAAPM